MGNVWCVTRTCARALLWESVMSVTTGPTRGGAPSVAAPACRMLTTAKSALFRKRMWELVIIMQVFLRMEVFMMCVCVCCAERWLSQNCQPRQLKDRLVLREKEVWVQEKMTSELFQPYSRVISLSILILATVLHVYTCVCSSLKLFFRLRECAALRR